MVNISNSTLLISLVPVALCVGSMLYIKNDEDIKINSQLNLASSKIANNWEKINAIKQKHQKENVEELDASDIVHYAKERNKRNGCDIWIKAKSIDKEDYGKWISVHISQIDRYPNLRAAFLKSDWNKGLDREKLSYIDKACYFEDMVTIERGKEKSRRHTWSVFGKNKKSYGRVWG